MKDSPEVSGGLSQPLTRRHVVLGAVLASASAVAYARLPTAVEEPVRTRDIEAAVPNTIGPWQFVSASGVVLPPPDELVERIYDNVVTRVYSSPTAPPVALLIAYNNIQDGVLQVHRPETCYPAGGYEITPTQRIDLRDSYGRLIPASIFTATSRERSERVIYWTRIGETFPQSWFAQRMAVAAANLKGAIPDGVLVRVSLIGDNEPNSLVHLKTFINELEKRSNPELRRLLTGRGSRT